MSGERAFEVEGLVIEVLSARTCRVELSNGHRVFAFVAGKKPCGKFSVGDRVAMEISPYDLSEGRINVEKTNNLKNESSRLS